MLKTTFAAIRRFLATPKPAIKALDALAEVHSPAPSPRQHELLSEAVIAGEKRKVDGEGCEGARR
jgi:hypothetical protein